MLARALLLVLVLASSARAAPCAHVSGDPDLVTAVAQLLADHGVQCEAVRAHLAREGASIVVTNDDAIPIARTVGDVATAAAVVESWSGTEVTDPLLASRPLPVSDEPAPVAAPVRPIMIEVVRPVPTTLHGYQVFAAGETSYANDRTTWLGMQLGGCVAIGPICTGARLREARVVAAPQTWTGQIDRGSHELLVGADVPIRFGHSLLSVGFGGGLGVMTTHLESTMQRMASETAGLRMDVHAAWSVPIGHGFAFDVSLAVDVTQATHTETTTSMPLPDEPLVLTRLGLGIRYGSLP